MLLDFGIKERPMPGYYHIAPAIPKSIDRVYWSIYSQSVTRLLATGGQDPPASLIKYITVARSVQKLVKPHKNQRRQFRQVSTLY